MTSYPSVAQIRARVRARRVARAALGYDGSSARAALVDADAERELGNAYGRASRARISAARERGRSARRDRQMIFAQVIVSLDLEHLVHGDQLAALAAILYKPDES